MAGRIPDLTPTIIDWETGEILFQGLEGPEVEMYRAEARENMKKWHQRRRERRAAQAAAATEDATAADSDEDPKPI